jgi:hypothetical protein
MFFNWTTLHCLIHYLLNYFCLFTACHEVNLGIVKALLDNTAYINCQTNSKSTALHIGMKIINADLIKINFLSLTCSRGHKSIVEIRLKNNVIIKLMNKI